MINRKNRIFTKKAMAFILLILVVITTSVAFVAARYISNNRKSAEIHASGFHFSSDYLETADHIVNVSDWSKNGIVFQLYNYEKENITQISDSNIEYKITIPEGWRIDSVKNNEGNIVPHHNSVYTIPKSDSQITHTVTVKYIGTGEPTAAAITAETVSPYKKSVKATFSIETFSKPTFTLKDDNNVGAVCMTIKANDYTGPIKVKWPSEEVSPDNANIDVDMSEWSNSNSEIGEVFQGEANHTYTLYFLKKSDSKIMGTFSVEGGY